MEPGPKLLGVVGQLLDFWLDSGEQLKDATPNIKLQMCNIIVRTAHSGIRQYRLGSSQVIYINKLEGIQRLATWIICSDRITKR